MGLGGEVWGELGGENWDGSRWDDVAIGGWRGYERQIDMRSSVEVWEWVWYRSGVEEWV